MKDCSHVWWTIVCLILLSIAIAGVDGRAVKSAAPTPKKDLDKKPSVSPTHSAGAPRFSSKGSAGRTETTSASRSASKADRVTASTSAWTSSAPTTASKSVSRFGTSTASKSTSAASASKTVSRFERPASTTVSKSSPAVSSSKTRSRAAEPSPSREAVHFIKHEDATRTLRQDDAEDDDLVELDDGELVDEGKDSGPGDGVLVRADQDVSERLLVGAIDGTVSALDAHTGRLLWSFSTGEQLVASSAGRETRERKTSPLAAIIPGLDGSVYAYHETEGLHRMPTTAPELVASSPFVASDGTVFLGDKHTRIFAVDSLTGVVREYGAAPAPDLCEAVTPERTLYVGRTDYVVRAVDSRGRESWNISYGETTPSLVPGDLSFEESEEDEPAGHEGALPTVHVAPDRSRLYRFDPTTGRVLWATTFPACPKSVHVIAGPRSLRHVTPIKGVRCTDRVCAPIDAGGAVVRPTHSGVPGGVLVAASHATKERELFVGVHEGHYFATDVPRLIRGPAEEEIPVTTGPGTTKPSPGHGGMVLYNRDHAACVGSAAFPACLLGLHKFVGHDPLLSLPFPTKTNTSMALPSGANDSAPGNSKTLLWAAALAAASLAVVSLALLWRRRTRRAAEEAAAEARRKKKEKEKEKEKEKAKTKKVVAPVAAPAPAPSLSMDGMISVGKIAFDSRKPLGTGSHGTMVYEGLFQNRPVAVKRMLTEFYQLAEQEISLLMESDSHPHVIRYYTKEEDTQFVYLALELCQRSLADLVEGHVPGSREHTATSTTGSSGRAAPAGPAQGSGAAPQKGIPRSHGLTVLHQIMRGVAFLHAQNIVHRDLKPGNVLISALGQAKISDFGVSKTLEFERSSFDTMRPGTLGWQAPEMLQSGGRCTKAVDVFSAGCLVHYVLTSGGHPFGGRYEREHHIVNAKSDLEALDAEARDLVASMILADPTARPAMEAVARHPLFWSDHDKLAFLLEASDRIEIEAQNTQTGMGPLVTSLEACAAEVLGPAGWGGTLDEGLLDNLGKYRKYDFSSLRDLLRLLRNKKHHYQDLPSKVRKKLGTMPSGFLEYFTSRFPLLLLAVYRVIREKCADTPQFERYFQEGVQHH